VGEALASICETKASPTQIKIFLINYLHDIIFTSSSYFIATTKLPPHGSCTSMVIIKLGGSLDASRSLLQCLQRIEQRYPNVATVIVPGGGLFADQVRLAQQRWAFDDNIAHNMALLAMQQMALLIKGLKKNFVLAHKISSIHQQSQHTTIWSPDIHELNNAGIPANWDVTSDSLAAWLAQQLAADELVLIKSAAIDPTLSLSELIRLNIVDKAFSNFTQQAHFKITLLQAHTF
jgi:5-(aminomethyl)-3-furanmethanol phosphate kinase